MSNRCRSDGLRHPGCTAMWWGGDTPAAPVHSYEGEGEIPQIPLHHFIHYIGEGGYPGCTLSFTSRWGGDTPDAPVHSYSISTHSHASIPCSEANTNEHCKYEVVWGEEVYGDEVMRYRSCEDSIDLFCIIVSVVDDGTQDLLSPAQSDQGIRVHTIHEFIVSHTGGSVCLGAFKYEFRYFRGIHPIMVVYAIDVLVYVCNSIFKCYLHVVCVHPGES